MKKILLFLLLFTNIAFAQVKPDALNSHIFFGDKVQYFEDKNNLEFPELLKINPAWQNSTFKYYNLGTTKSAYWIRFDIENRSGNDLFLTFNTINMNSIKLYIVEKDGSYIEKTGGHIYPFNHREVYDKDIFFKIPESKDKKTVYVRLNTTYMMFFMPEIVTSDKRSERSIKIYTPYALYFGLLIAFLFYNSFIFISTGEKAYIKLVFVLLAFALYDISQDGFGFMFLWPDRCYFESIAIPLSVGLAGSTLGLFLNDVLETRKNYRIAYYLINSFIITCSLSSVLSLFFGKDIMLLVYFSVIHGSLFMIFILFYLAFIKRNRSAVILFTAYIILNISHIIAVISNVPILHKQIQFFSNYFGILFLMKSATAWLFLMYSYALADKINIMKKNLEITYDKLEKSEQTYRTIFNGTNEAIAILDRKTGTLIDANIQLLKMFDEKSENIIGRTPQFFSSAEDGYTDPKAFVLFNDVIENPLRSVEWLCKKRNNEKFWAEINLSKVIINGTQRILCVLRDISDRKKAEHEREIMLNQLSQVQKMEAVGSLAGGLAHDFNNILTGILGSSSLIEKQLKENMLDKNRIEKYIIMIKETSIKAAATVRCLLTLTRKTELKFEHADVNQSVKNVIDICLNSFPKSVSIQVKYYDKPAVIRADISGLEQSLLNILVNASHAVTTMRKPSEPEGGIISVKIDKQYADEAFCRSNTEAVKNIYYFSVSVQDNGCGIEKEIINKIFDPFFTTKGGSGGSGLGLSMVYNIIRQHDGLIKVYSEKEVGTTFIIYLPENLSEKISEETENDTVIKGHGRILIIDDEHFVREIAHDILAECGYDVITAASGIEGVGIFRDNADILDAVLLDVSMPGLSGLETFKELKKIRASIKIIMSSGFSMDERVQKTFDLGADSFIQKPYTNIQLSIAISELLLKNDK